LKDTTKGANRAYSYLAKIHALAGNNAMLNHPLVVHFDAMLESQTDGVGTKVRIYMRQYNIMYEEYKR